jgi:hypothetical protein
MAFAATQPVRQRLQRRNGMPRGIERQQAQVLLFESSAMHKRGTLSEKSQQFFISPF